MTKDSFVARLADENREFYGTPDGRGLLRAFELTFEHRWLYLFELVQNAIDAGARSMALRLAEDGDALIFQHDGDHPLDEKAVEALSKVFRSTKGASSEGFMGVGFKSVFGRFREARISGWEWTFRYEIKQVTGETYGDVQPDLLGAVVPIWDGSITAPEPGFTTRFEMRQRADGGADLKADLAHFLPDDDHTLLAILAASGLKRLEVDDRTWELEVGEESDGTMEAFALSEDENRRWRLFSVEFNPSKEAIARFLEHRRIQPLEEEREQVHAEAARPRRVLGLLPLDDDGTPAPPARGRIYATLPTGVTLPFRLHINADWLLNISRSGLREIEDNPWQRDIVDCIADVLASFLDWTARAFSEPAPARAAFAALAPPSPEAGGIEALLAEERWLSRLRTLLEDAAVLPVWTEETDALAFTKPGDAILPPPPLAKAFKEQPALRPAVLLKGPVVMDEVLGPGARDLLDQAGLLAEMSPRDLERTWPDGLARWWKTLADDQEGRRALLFRIWAAVAELTSEDPWRDVDLPCVRTATGRWLPVNEVVFFDEPFPSKREPGGDQTHQFMRPFIPESRLPDGWIVALRKGAANERWGSGPLSQAREWIEAYARRISLREVAGEAMNALASSPAPDWSVLIPLGHWAKHRNRPGLLTRVLVESDAGPMGVPAEEALLADPYVEDRQGRRLLFPTKSAISATYLEQDSRNADAREWRAFFEKIRVKGKLEVQPVKSHADRWERERVAEFLGVDIHEIRGSNDRGYELVDYDIEPNLPSPDDAPEELRIALAAWIDDGYEALQGKGRRRIRYFYHHSRNDPPGNTPSAWVKKLTKLAWIPCNDGKLRCPQDVLPRPDPGREDAPVAELSPDLLGVLEQEGVKFGAAIPEAAVLRKLLAAGSGLDAEPLAQLLRECRDEITTDEDRRRLEAVLQTLTVPMDGSRRVPLCHVVQRVGGRGRRGALGGWIVPLDRIDEALRVELEHPDIPCEFPDTTTGAQALAYIRNVWKDARSVPEGLANKVRDVLPAAYAYCLEDCADDTALFEQWRAAMTEAAVFAEREWVVLAGSRDVYFDDVNDRRFLPGNMQVRTATGGHLGRNRPEQLDTVEALELPLLSSSIEMEWHEGGTLTIGNDWGPGFDLICHLLRRVRGNEQAESDGAGVDPGTKLRLKRVHELVLEVSIENAPAERVPVNARLNDDVLTVAGRPVQFGSDAAKELLRHFSFVQRGDLAADLTGMLGAIDDRSDFIMAADKFRRSFAPDFDLLEEMFPCGSDTGEVASSEDGPARTADAGPDNGKTASRGRPGASAPSPGDSEPGKSDSSGGASAAGVRDGGSVTAGHDKSSSTSGSYTKDRALAQPNALAEKLRSALKGELIPSDDDDDPSEAARTNGSSDAGLGDEEYRKDAMRYERKAGRKPVLGDPRQTGWDIHSLDPKTGEIVRLIEVKGKGRPWDGDEVVELSRAQVRKAFAASADGTPEWYLYVVEKTDDGYYQVLPVANPVHAAKWILCGGSWRVMAEAEIRRDASRSDRNG